MKNQFMSLWLRSIVGLPPKITEMKSFDVIQYMKSIGYKARMEYVQDRKRTKKKLHAQSKLPQRPKNPGAASEAIGTGAPSDR
jgi:hypothetical protein